MEILKRLPRLKALNKHNITHINVHRVGKCHPQFNKSEHRYTSTWVQAYIHLYTAEFGGQMAQIGAEK